MKKLILIFALLYTSSTMADEYVRSIRVASFYTQERAQNAIATLEVLSLDFHNCRENIVYRVRKIGIYYVLLVEPFRNKLLLQGTIDKIRINYPDAYVSKYKKTDVNIPFKLNSYQQEKSNPPKVIIKEIEKIKTVTKVVVKKEYIESQYKALFYFISALFLGTMLFFIIKVNQKGKQEPSKEEKENSSLKVAKEVVLEDEFDDIDIDDVDLDDDIDFEESIDGLDLLAETRDNLRDLHLPQNSELGFKIEEIVVDSQISIRKIQKYSSENREKELLEEILRLKSLSESLAVYLNAIAIESMKSERVIQEVDKIKLLLTDLSSATQSSQTKSS